MRIDPEGTRTRHRHRRRRRRRRRRRPTATTGGAHRCRRLRRRVPTPRARCAERLPASAQQVSSVLLCPLNRTQRPLLGADRGCAIFFFFISIYLLFSRRFLRPRNPFLLVSHRGPLSLSVSRCLSFSLSFSHTLALFVSFDLTFSLSLSVYRSGPRPPCILSRTETKSNQWIRRRRRWRRKKKKKNIRSW